LQIPLANRPLDSEVDDLAAEYVFIREMLDETLQSSLLKSLYAAVGGIRILTAEKEDIFGYIQRSVSARLLASHLMCRPSGPN
jgi:hypothetical protein